MADSISYLIIGGGPVGLIAGKVLQQQRKEFLGLEKSDRLGGKDMTLPTRIFSSASVDFFRSLLPELEWNLTNGASMERIKGEWREISDSAVSATEKPFLQCPYYSPAHAWIEKVAEDLGGKFNLRHQVEQIFPDEKKVVCKEGQEFHYETLLWCADLEKLRKAWKGDVASLLKVLKGMPEATGAIDLEMELATPLKAESGSILFPFRYKDKKLRAIGVSDEPTSHHIHWLVPLDEELGDDREEIAKCVRTLKRELGKEFSDLKEHTHKERILFYPRLSLNEPKEVKSLSALPDVLYLGPQLRREESEKTLMHFDVALDNCRYFEQTLKG